MLLNPVRSTYHAGVDIDVGRDRDGFFYLVEGDGDRDYRNLPAAKAAAERVAAQRAEKERSEAVAELRRRIAGGLAYAIRDGDTVELHLPGEPAREVTIRYYRMNVYDWLDAIPGGIEMFDLKVA